MERTAGQRSFGLESGGIRDLCLVSASAGRGGGAGLALDVMGMRNFWRGTICGDRELWAGVGRKDGGALPLFIGRSTSARSLPAAGMGWGEMKAFLLPGNLAAGFLVPVFVVLIGRARKKEPIFSAGKDQEKADIAEKSEDKKSS